MSNQSLTLTAARYPQKVYGVTLIGSALLAFPALWVSGVFISLSFIVAYALAIAGVAIYAKGENQYCTDNNFVLFIDHDEPRWKKVSVMLFLAMAWLNVSTIPTLLLAYALPAEFGIDPFGVKVAFN